MKGQVKWLADATFVAESENGHTVTIDGSPAKGGMRPMEMVLLGVGGCTSFDVMSILKKSRQPVTGCVAQLEAQRADAVPSVFTSIHIHFIVTGKDLKESQVKRAVELSAEKYCSASIMLRQGGVEVTHDYELVEAENE